MPYVRFGLVALNALAFLILFVLAWRGMRRERSTRVRRLWIVVMLASGALILGAGQRIVLQASMLEWLPEAAAIGIVEDWQLFQSLLVVSLVAAVFITIRKLAASMAASERIAGSILDRVGHVDVAEVNLTQREQEVLATIGSGLLTDQELAETLHISSATVQTHVKSLLRKTGLNKRQDLIAVAFLLETERHSSKPG
ncbi:MAG TPA: LuxR C-terminal-related transcriptional regulator [Acidimicrobiia bacterium]|nr:LuxR C-terminal-related transcriptional regulator [Acidimicrobiia bacterium]